MSMISGEKPLKKGKNTSFSHLTRPPNVGRVTLHFVFCAKPCDSTSFSSVFGIWRLFFSTGIQWVNVNDFGAVWRRVADKSMKRVATEVSHESLQRK